jgi:16S rRNA G966 N2-methylase RsmD
MDVHSLHIYTCTSMDTRTHLTDSSDSLNKVKKNIQYQILAGTVKNILHNIPDNFFTGVCCDPPYEIGFADWDKTGISFDSAFWALIEQKVTVGSYISVIGYPMTIGLIQIAMMKANLEIIEIVPFFRKGRNRGKYYTENGIQYCRRFQNNYLSILIGRKKGTTVPGIRMQINSAGDHRPPSNVIGDAGVNIRPTVCHFLPASADAETGGKCPFVYESDMKSYKKYHPCGKPPELAKWITSLFLPDTHTKRMLVPFCGSGSEMIGAALAGWTEIVGIEQNMKYVEIAHQRCRSHHLLNRPLTPYDHDSYCAKFEQPLLLHRTKTKLQTNLLNELRNQEIKRDSHANVVGSDGTCELPSTHLLQKRPYKKSNRPRKTRAKPKEDRVTMYILAQKVDNLGNPVKAYQTAQKICGFFSLFIWKKVYTKLGYRTVRTGQYEYELITKASILNTPAINTSKNYINKTKQE